MTLLAHAGHWLPQLLYVVPVAVMAGAVAWSKVKERRNKRSSRGLTGVAGGHRPGDDASP